MRALSARDEAALERIDAGTISTRVVVTSVRDLVAERGEPARDSHGE